MQSDRAAHLREQDALTGRGDLCAASRLGLGDEPVESVLMAAENACGLRDRECGWRAGSLVQTRRCARLGTLDERTKARRVPEAEFDRPVAFAVVPSGQGAIAGRPGLTDALIGALGAVGQPIVRRGLSLELHPDVLGLGLLGLGRVPKHLGVERVVEPDLADRRCALRTVLRHPRSTTVRQTFQRRAHAPDSCANRSSAASATARTRSGCP